MTGAKALVAKASEGSGFHDPLYGKYHDQAARLGIPFAAYHWINTEDLDLQVRNLAAIVTDHTPIMWDCEASGATVPRILDATSKARARGLVVTLVYLPHWWWANHLGSPDLRPLRDAGLSLVSSNYTDVPDAGWAPYGGVTPAIWQFADDVEWRGDTVDMNRFNGTIDQLAAVFKGETIMATDPGVIAEQLRIASLYYDTPDQNVPTNPDGPNGLHARLVRMEQKLDQLLAGPTAAGVAAHTHIPGAVADAPGTP